MLDIVFVRIDDRLIHGQVVTGWMRQTLANRIVIVDDLVAKDPFMLKILKMAAPPKVAVNAYTLEDGIKLLKGEPKSPNEKVLVLAKTPDVILALVEAGVDIKYLNVGGMGSKPGRKKLFRNIQASPEEIEVFKKLSELGVKVEFRVIVSNKGVSLEDVLSGKKK
ncbi:PTS system mannose/fructose/N-acetylgalactosamine-transporter subunit IIB [Maledivibacter halophilus]|uniref:PTS system, mannose-specific IIB component n=1 Tax=Maledivibacter halophilus TaxID=36842 RepID=A0A1T5L2P1_9FIRM|nr:PTS sugar transporter subunit IIB [Maledivibacter halophilus]SKC69879.1 PTS system, mannose-specific IIB component [Maledivibacter halophilus]